jgi:GT2 family glycosyltransferase
MDAIVVSHNSERELHGLLSSPPVRTAFERIVVVDNASEDGSAALAREHGAEVIARPSNVGFGAAVNGAARHVRGSAFAVLNPDIRLRDSAVVARLAARLADPRVAIVAPALELPDGSIQDSARAVPNPLTLAVRRQRDVRRGWMAWEHVKYVDWVVGAFMVIRRAAFDAVGGFDPGYFLYFEDVDLCVRLRRAGWKIAFEGDAVALHAHRAESRRPLTAAAVRSHARSAARFYRRHPTAVVPRRLRRRERELRKPPVAFIAWSDRTERAAEIAASLDGEAWELGPMGLRGPITTPVRYPVNAIRTATRLALRRPRALIVQNPPIVPGVIAVLYGRLTGAPVALDSHPSSFGLRGARLLGRLQPLHAWLARRARVVLVTVEDLEERIGAWGGRGLVVHEAPPAWRVETSHEDEPRRPRVLFVGVFAPDEPLAAVLDAAAQLPEVDVQITGDLRRRPDWSASRSPRNVEWLGFLRGADYVTALARADIVMALTTDRTSVVRAGYEAVYARKPLVVTESRALRAAFPHAIHVPNTADDVARGVRSALARLDELRAATETAHDEQHARWDRQVRELAASLELGRQR